MKTIKVNDVTFELVNTNTSFNTNFWLGTKQDGQWYYCPQVPPYTTMSYNRELIINSTDYGVNNTYTYEFIDVFLNSSKFINNLAKIEKDVYELYELNGETPLFVGKLKECEEAMETLPYYRYRIEVK